MILLGVDSQSYQPAIMNTSVLSVLALCCIVSLTLANYGSYTPYYGAQSSGGIGDNTLLMFAGVMVVLFLLFSRMTQNTTNIINLTAPSP